MWAAALVLSLAMAQAPPPACVLPDLSTPHVGGSSDFEVHEVVGGYRGVSMSDPMGDEGERLPGMPDEPPPPLQHSDGSSWLWSEASGWLLVPVGFEVQVAVVGVNGSWVIEMGDAKAPTARRLRAHSTGACVGCAYSAGAAYFKSYAQAARENEFEFCRGLERPIVRERESDSRLRFHYDDLQGLRQDAVAIIGGDDIGYREMVVRGLDAAATDEILGAFGP
ncbi:MAG TPA: DUF4850 domain-containing protein [Xanthomonadales bacterium]|nr:DUF4850 domain-containing protein [Xanthomonadales bacterium]